MATGPANATVKPLLTLAKRRLADDDELKMRWSFVIPRPLSSPLEPTAHGIEIGVCKTDDAGVLDPAGVANIVIPGGIWEGTREWKVNSAGTKWLHLDRADPPALNGIYKIKARDMSRKNPEGQR